MYNLIGRKKTGTKKKSSVGGAIGRALKRKAKGKNKKSRYTKDSNVFGW
jgi:hypothetical protein